MITFKKVESSTENSPGPSEEVPKSFIYIPLSDKSEIEYRLFHFLQSLPEGRFRIERPLLTSPDVLRVLYEDPHPTLRNALENSLSRLLIEFSPDTASWGDFELSPSLSGLTIALYNAMAPVIGDAETGADPATAFSHALIDTLNPARTLGENLAYHALLRVPAESLPHLAPERAQVLRRLIHLCPLTSILHLHTFTPPVLTERATELLPDWKDRVEAPSPWRGLDEWLDVLAPLLARPAIAVHLRQQWLSFPESRTACRNLGLLLEALRKRGDRDFLLTFYEAYDYENGVERETLLGGKFRYWPILDRISDLLKIGGDSEKGLEAAQRLNRIGREYFLLFHPLTQIIRETGGVVPKDYRHLSPGWIPALRPLLEHVQDDPAPRMKRSDVEFISVEENETEPSGADGKQ